MKLNQSPALQKLQNMVEGDYIRDKKIHELEAELFFVIDEKGHTISLTDKGRVDISPDNPEMFTLPDIVDEIAKIEQRTDLEPMQKEQEKNKVREFHSLKAEELHNISQLLRAYSLFEKDVDYVIQENKVIIVDEFTGRLMPGRRYSDGLHQALEAKENVVIEKETQTLATVTIQNYFRMYKKLAGMTGTAYTEAQEFEHTYKMDVVQIPTNRPVKRLDYNDVIYRTKREKINAIIDEIIACHEKNLPVLVGTVSVEASEVLSRMLQRQKISHSVLNAKNHEREAQIVKDAGQSGTVTIATNMAGRGTDIKLGWGVIKCAKCCIRCEDDCAKSPECNGTIQKIMQSLSAETKEKTFEEIGKQIKAEVTRQGQELFVNPEYLGKVVNDSRFEGKDSLVFKKTSKDFAHCEKECPCGLQIIGTERHEARRIDLQLRGRAGRQGDPGGSKFFLSLEDDLMRLFGSDRIIGVMERMGMQEGETIQHGIITRAISNAQKKIEEINFGRRKHTLEYDDIMNKQRVAIYGLRREVLMNRDSKETLLEICQNALHIGFTKFGDPDSKHHDEWDLKGYIAWVSKCIPYVDLSKIKIDFVENYDDFIEEIFKKVEYAYELKREVLGDELMGEITRFVVLRTIDTDWQDHLLAIDDLQEGIHFRAYAQQDPLVEYKREATRMYDEMLDNVNKEIFEHFFLIQVRTAEPRRPTLEKASYVKEEATKSPEQLAAIERAKRASVSQPEPQEQEEEKLQPVKRDAPKVGRNDACPCGSGKKYKKCCGRDV